jgi:succinoglycan biosynthesis protein ExoU
MSNIQTITVIIAAYNAEKTLSRALDSVVHDKQVAQVIIVDDCSIDNTLSIANSYKEKYSAVVTVFTTGVNSGPSTARNIALKHCNTDWVTVLDSDDFIEKGRFDKLLSNSEGYQLIADEQYRLNEGDLISAKTRMLNGSRSLPCEITLSDFISANISIKGRARQELGFIKPLIRRDFLLKHNLNYQTNMRLGEDYELYCRCLALGARLRLIEPAGYVAVVRSNSLSGAHSTHDLIQLRDCNYKICQTLVISDIESALFKEHATSIDNKVQWRLFYGGLKNKKLLQSFTAFTGSFIAFTFIVKQLACQFNKRILKIEKY